MDIKRALKGQYHAGLAMLRDAIERCPEDVWMAGTHPRNTWRIAYHAVFYTHLYLMKTEVEFQPWVDHRNHVPALWIDEDGPPVEEPYSKAEVLTYLEMVDSCVNGWVDAMDLESPTSGFSWYSIPKLDHQLLNIRHLQGHVGQLSELVMQAGHDLDWITIR